MTESIFVSIRDDVSKELCGCLFDEAPPEYENEIEAEAFRRYEDWQEDQRDMESIYDNDSFVHNVLMERLGLNS